VQPTEVRGYAYIATQLYTVYEQSGQRQTFAPYIVHVDEMFAVSSDISPRSQNKAPSSTSSTVNAQSSSNALYTIQPVVKPVVKRV